jgi:hypothetical protein
MEISRRAVVQAVAVVPAVAAIPQTPLSSDELRVLAMTATPSEAWRGSHEEYEATRVFKQTSDTIEIARGLEARGLVEFRPTYGWASQICEDSVHATPAGLEELRKLGVEV